MKATCLLPVAMAAMGTCAMAQNSTVFGRVDLGLQSIDMDGAKRTGVDSGNYTSSRLGFRGTEDLGGGLSALYHLEMGIAADSGTAGNGNRLFNRGSYMGLADKSLGTLTLGRQYTPMFYPFLNADETGRLRLGNYSTVNSIQRTNLLRVAQAALTVPVANGALASGAKGTYSAGTGSSWEDNQLLYKTPTFAGFTASVSASPSENYTDSTKLYGGNIEYRNGAFYAGGGINRKYGKVTATGALQRSDEAVLGALYAITSSFKIWGNVHGWEVDPGAGASATIQGRDAMLGASYWTSSGELWTNYARKTVSSCSDCGSDGLGIGYNHFLSNRTELYVAYGRVGNQRNSANTFMSYAPTQFGGTVQGLAAGIAHVF
ncbi:porin [Variovorax sp. OV329]|uniref:porin n=1 Tax=Variovorax sp. OV329 TaxID=1882825 RepID=UPI0008E6A195|nr:porin [Variovorax sp. OV329]SFM05877.1 Outer membrane protein (porin) [Variovorax sp. OV329]